MYDIITTKEILNSNFNSIYNKKIRQFLLLNDINFYEQNKHQNDHDLNKKFTLAVFFPTFNISKIRENLDKIICCMNDDECYKYNEVDVILSEDIILYKSFREMHKNCISYAFNFSELLNLRTSQRIKKISIMRKNFKLVKKYKVNYIIGSFAKNVFEFRSYYALFSFGKILGMNDEEAYNAISKNYEKILNKFKKRNDKFYIMDGFKVIKFSDKEKNFKKKKYGYY